MLKALGPTLWGLGFSLLGWGLRRREGESGAFLKPRSQVRSLLGALPSSSKKQLQNGGDRCCCGTKAALADRTECDAVGRSGTWAGAIGGQRDPARHAQDVSRQDSDFVSTLGDGSKVVRSASAKARRDRFTRFHDGKTTSYCSLSCVIHLSRPSSRPESMY